MATFNKSTTAPAKPNMINHEGSAVYSLKPLETLFSKVLGSFFGESTFYEKKSAESDFQRLQTLIKEVSPVDKEYVLKIAELGRLCKMISYPVEILTACLNDDDYKDKFVSADGKSKMPYYFDRIVQRTKDMNDIVATHLSIYTRKTGFPKQMREGIRKKIQSYDQYKLSKGIEVNSDVSLSDLIKLFRPKPKTPAMSAFYKKIMENEVVVGDGKKQIQTELTIKGQQKTESNVGLVEAVLKADVENILRNLVTIYNNGLFKDPMVKAHIISKLRSPEAIQSSKILPIRFYSAYKELSKFGLEVRDVLEAIEDAMDISIANTDVIEGTGAILVDVSGSMDNVISEKSAVTATEVALILAAIAFKKGNSDLFVFASQAQLISMSRRTPIFAMIRQMRQNYAGGGTDLKSALNTLESHAKTTNINYDYLLILSDNDCYGYNNGVLTFGERSVFRSSKGSADDQINRLISQGVFKKLWLNNLLGNEFTIVNTAAYNKNLITGFSEKYIDIINIYNNLGAGRDIKKVIDAMLEKERSHK